MHYIYQSTDSVTKAVYRWTSSVPDPLGSLYPGPNAPTDVIQVNDPKALASASSAGLMTAAQVTQLNAAILSKAHGRSETNVALTTDSATVLIPYINIVGLAPSSTYSFVVGARIPVHQTSDKTICGFVDVVAFGYAITNSSGVVTTLRIKGTTPDQSKLTSTISTTTASIEDGATDYFYITITRSYGVAMTVDAVEYWISSLEKLTT